MTTFADGVFQYGGQPVGGAALSVPQRNSKVLFVDADNGADGNNGASPTTPVATIQRALDLLEGGGYGGTVMVFPGTYAENLSVETDGVTLQGVVLGGYMRPDVTPASGIPLTVTGQGFVCRHMRFAGTAADGVKQQGNGFEYTDCVFDGDGTAAKAGVRLVGSSTASSRTASEGIIQHCLFRGCANGLLLDTAPAASSGVGSTDNDILCNKFVTNTLDIATQKTGAGGAYSVQRTRIKGNTFADKNKATYIDITTNEDGSAASQTGSVEANGFASDTMTTTKIKAVGTGFTFFGNYDTVGIFDGSGLD